MSDATYRTAPDNPPAADALDTQALVALARDAGCS